METQHFIQNSAAGGTVVIAVAVPGLRSNVYAMILTAAGAVTATLQDTSGAAISEPFAFGTNGGAVTIDVKVNGDPWFNTGIGLGLQLAISAAVQVSGDIYWMQTP
jgi:hypothetical protein